MIYKPLLKFETSNVFLVLKSVVVLTVLPNISKTLTVVSIASEVFILITSFAGLGYTEIPCNSKSLVLKVEVGRGINSPPEANATHKPKPDPLLFAYGSKNPLATTVIAAPSNPKVANGALYSSTTVAPSAVVTLIV